MGQVVAQLYGEIMGRFALNFRTIYAALSAVGKACGAAGEPIITALVINKKTGRCSAGIEKEFGITDDAAERGRCYAYGRDEQRNNEPITVEQSTEMGSSDTSDHGRDESVPGGAEDRLTGVPVISLHSTGVATPSLHAGFRAALARYPRQISHLLTARFRPSR
ncbi:hypothetical protein [Cupriavidus sp. D384]|uniref:hypothetical protein n=1 Tax=Cupriavidus sp. D384 TaxID=1538095 RepID=UPI000836538A|nr:hypothetical protein [Cupriavidus sp. D384]